MEFSELDVGRRVRGTILSIVVGVVLPLTIIMFIVAFATDQWSRADLQTDIGWMTTTDVYMTGGLWSRCDYIGTISYCRSLVGSEETSGEWIE